MIITTIVHPKGINMKLNLTNILLCILTLSGCNGGGSGSDVQTTTQNNQSTALESNSAAPTSNIESTNIFPSTYFVSNIMPYETSKLKIDVNGSTYLVGTTITSYTAQMHGYSLSGTAGTMIVQRYFTDSQEFGLVSSYNNYQYYNCYHTTGFDADSEGNLYIVGYSTLSCDDTSHANAIVMKYNSINSISPEWIYELGDGYYSNDIKAFDIYFNKDDNSLYVVGSTSKQLGSTSQIGKIDAFVAKLDSDDGHTLSLTQFGGKNANVYPKAIAHYNNSLIITGSTDQKINSSNTGQTGLHDAFISVVDTNTNKLSWTYQFGATNGNTYATSNAILDRSGILTVVGYTDKGILGQSKKGNIDYFIVQWYFSDSVAISSSQSPRFVEQRGMPGASSYAYHVTAMPNTDINTPNGADVFVEGSTSTKLFNVCDYRSGVCSTESNIKGVYDAFVARYGSESAPYSMFGKFKGGLQFDYPSYGLSSNSLGVARNGIIMLPVNIYGSEKCTPTPYEDYTLRICTAKYSSVLEWKANLSGL